MNNRNFVLGTANWGRPYGNSIQPINEGGAHEILDSFLEHGYNHVDTAHNYGKAHEYLSTYKRVNELKITTKFQSEMGIDEIVREIDRVGINFHTIMFHSVPISRGRIEDLIESGHNNIGISLNSIYEMQIIRPFLMMLSKVQIPYNIIDRRWEEFFFEFISNDIEIESRSAFLQGQLLIDDSTVLSQNANLNDQLKKWKENKSMNQRVMSCVKFQRSHRSIKSFVFGVDSLVQLIELIEVFNEPTPYVEESFENFNDETLLLPMNWKTS